MNSIKDENHGAVAGQVDCRVRPAAKKAASNKEHDQKASAWIERQRIVRCLLNQADAAHEAQNYHDHARFRDAAWLVERA